MSEIIQNDERAGLPSASSMDADIRCKGRRALIRKAPKKEEKPDRDRDRGTAIHFVLEGKGDFDAMCESDKVTTGIIMNEEARLVDENHMEGAEILREKRLFGMDAELNPLYSARLDSIHLKKTAAMILDYKSGFSFNVPIRDNWQMRTQAVLAHIHYDVPLVGAGLIHPHHPESISEFAVFNLDNLKLFEMQIVGHIGEMTEHAPRTPNGISCQYCPAKGICPEYQAHMAQIAAARPTISRMSADERGQRIRDIKMFTKNAEVELAEFKELLLRDPDSVDGWRLQPGKSKEITNHQRAGEILAEKEGPGAAEAAMVTEFEFKRALEYLHKQKGMKKKEAEERLLMILKPVLVWKSQSPKMVEA